MQHPSSATTPAPGRTATPSWAPVVLGLFVVVSAARLVAIPLELGDLARSSTFLLMPSLALWVLVRRGPILLVVALLCSAAGDILLGTDGLFLAGMGAFALAHVAYVTLFVRSGALAALRRRWFLLLPYFVVLDGLTLWLWPHLGELRIPVLAYAVLLTATAVTAGALDWRLGLGGALFFVSDAMIAMWSIADRPAPPLPGLWIMSTYILAQYLLASGALRLGLRRGGGEPA
jgi:Predicted membrane protein